MITSGIFEEISEEEAGDGSLHQYCLCREHSHKNWPSAFISQLHGREIGNTLKEKAEAMEAGKVIYKIEDFTGFKVLIKESYKHKEHFTWHVELIGINKNMCHADKLRAMDKFLAKHKMSSVVTFEFRKMGVMNLTITKKHAGVKCKKNTCANCRCSGCN